MTDRDPLTSFCLAFCLLAVGCCIARALSDINASLRKINDTIDYRSGLEVAQYSWLVEHYAKPVRPIYPWEKHRCEWCGQEKTEDGK